MTTTLLYLAPSGFLVSLWTCLEEGGTLKGNVTMILVNAQDCSGPVQFRQANRARSLSLPQPTGDFSGVPRSLPGLMEPTTRVRALELDQATQATPRHLHVSAETRNPAELSLGPDAPPGHA